MEGQGKPSPYIADGLRPPCAARPGWYFQSGYKEIFVIGAQGKLPRCRQLWREDGAWGTSRCRQPHFVRPIAVD
jgi:hypothetical protein